MEDLTYCKILETNINVTTMRDTVAYLTEKLDSLRGDYICVSNVHTTVMSYQDPAYRNIQNTAAMALPDGRPLSIYSRFHGHSSAQKVSGPDLMPKIFACSKEKGFRHFFYGSTEETLAKLKENLDEKYPGMNVVGMYSPPFRPLTEDEDMAIVEEINKCKPDFIWIGLGAPKQEQFMYEHRGMFTGVMLGVGAGFDFHAGTLKRAPYWMQRYGLEWLYRITQDPRRMAKRYFKSNVAFIWLILRGK